MEIELPVRGFDDGLLDGNLNLLALPPKLPRLESLAQATSHDMPTIKITTNRPTAVIRITFR